MKFVVKLNAPFTGGGGGGGMEREDLNEQWTIRFCFVQEKFVCNFW